MNVAHTVFHTCPLLLCMLLRWNKNVSKYVWVSDCKDGRVCCSTCKQWPVFLLCRCAYADYIKYQTDLRRCSGSCEKYLDSGRSQISIPAVFYLDCLQFRKPNVKVERPFALLTAGKKRDAVTCKVPFPRLFWYKACGLPGEVWQNIKCSLFWKIFVRISEKNFRFCCRGVAEDLQDANSLSY